MASIVMTDQLWEACGFTRSYQNYWAHQFNQKLDDHAIRELTAKGFTYNGAEIYYDASANKSISLDQVVSALSMAMFLGGMASGKNMVRKSINKILTEE